MLECGEWGRMGAGARRQVLGCGSGFYSGSTWRDWGALGSISPPCHLQAYYKDSGEPIDICVWHLGRGMVQHTSRVEKVTAWSLGS